MGVKLGTLDISAFKVGSRDCKVYLGETLLYPFFQGKWLATYSDGTKASADCDSSSAITYSEIAITDLVSVEIGDCVTSIGNQAFYRYSGLTSCTIGSGVTSIGEGAFQYCFGLTRLNSDADGVFNIPSGVTSIGNQAFLSCRSLTSIDIPSGVTSISQQAFQYCTGLTSITVNATTPPALGNYAFYATNDCPVYVPSESLNVYKSATNWSDYASRLYPIPEPKFTATYIGGIMYKSEKCNTATTLTTSITKPNGYDYTTMLSAEINDCITSIGDNAFSDCSSLSSITIPNTITSIGDYAFSGCSSLSSITFDLAIPPTLGVSAFTNDVVIYVPCSSAGSYRVATNWSDYSSNILG